jgi:hypothetical protein
MEVKEVNFPPHNAESTEKFRVVLCRATIAYACYDELIVPATQLSTGGYPF